MFEWLPWVRARRDRLANTPLSAAQRDLLRRRVPTVTRLGDDATARLEGLVQLFLADKSFEGLGGLEVTEEVRLTIAGQACLLLLGLDVEWPYPGLDVIRIYPGAYRAPAKDWEGGVEREGLHHRLGESSGRGFVVLSWTAARLGSANPDDGENVVLHEFAHQLDQASGHANGAPVLHSAAQYEPWAEVLSEAFGELQHDVRARRQTVLDAYGTVNEAEFFAVATEAFFERPRALKREEPDLYEVLAGYYRQDPASW